MRFILKLCGIVVLGLSIFNCVLDLGESDLELIVDVSEDILAEADSLEAIAFMGDTSIVLYRGTSTDGVFAQGAGQLVKDSVEVFVKQFEDGNLIRNVKYRYLKSSSRLSLIDKTCVFPLCSEFLMNVASDVDGNADSLEAKVNIDSRKWLLKNDLSNTGIFRDTIMGTNLDTLNATLKQFDNKGNLIKETNYNFAKIDSSYVLLGKECVYPKCLDILVDLNFHVLQKASQSVVLAYYDDTSSVLVKSIAPGSFQGNIQGVDIDNIDIILTQYDDNSDVMLQTLYRYSTSDQRLSFIGVLSGDKCQILHCRINRRIKRHVIINDTTSLFGTVSDYFYTNESLDSILVFNGSVVIEPNREPSGVRRFEYGLQTKRVIQEFIQEPTVDSLYQYDFSGRLIKVQVEERGLIEMDTIIYGGFEPQETRHYSDGVLTRIVRHSIEPSTFTLVDSIFVGNDSLLWGVERFEYNEGILIGKKIYKRRSGSIQLTESIELTYEFDKSAFLTLEETFSEGISRSLATIKSYEYLNGELTQVSEIDEIGNRLVYIMTFEYEGEIDLGLMKKAPRRNTFSNEITLDRIQDWSRVF